MTIDTLNQINDIMAVLNNTRKAVQKPQSDKSFAQTLQQTIEQNAAPVAQHAQQTVTRTVEPKRWNMFDGPCCVDGCNKKAVVWVKSRPYCKEHEPDTRVDTEEAD